MLLLINSTNSAQNISWWLKAIGCKNDVSRTQLQNWYVEKKRGIPESTSPIIITGMLSKISGLALGIIGLNKENKFLEWCGILLGAAGLGLSASGGVFTYNLISEAKSNKITEEKGEEKPPKVIEKIVEHHHHYYEKPSIQSKSESDMTNIATLKDPETISNSKDLVALFKSDEKAEESRPEEEALKESIDIQSIINKTENTLDAEITISQIRNIFSQINKKEISNAVREEAYNNLFNLIGRNLSDIVLLHALSDKSYRINKWAVVCLLDRELSEKTEKGIIESALNNPEIIGLLRSYKELTGEQFKNISQKAEIIYKQLFPQVKTA